MTVCPACVQGKGQLDPEWSTRLMQLLVITLIPSAHKGVNISMELRSGRRVGLMPKLMPRLVEKREEL